MKTHSTGNIRIACVQNGDFTTAFRTLAKGGPETYNGQRYTVEAFSLFTRNHPSLVISLDAPAHEEVHGSAMLYALGPIPRRPWLPERFVLKAYAGRIIKKLEAMETNFLLLRCVDVIGCELLAWANQNRVPAAVIIAARFDPKHPQAVRFCELANDPNVLFVANHNRVATETCVECGLKPEKAIAWDLPRDVVPDERSKRTRTAGQPLRILSAGSVEPAKGISDLIEGCQQARSAGTDVRLTVCGRGPLLDELRNHAGVNEGWLELTNRIPQDEVVRRMYSADVVAVPSRYEFCEGLPFVIQEGLAVGTPLVLSDHPVFVRYFQEGKGVRFFPAKDPTLLAKVITELAADHEQYARLSSETAAVWATLACPTTFQDLLDRMTASWGLLNQARTSINAELNQLPSDSIVQFVS